MENTNNIGCMGSITFDGKHYKTRLIHVKGFGDVTVATCSLQGVLFNSCAGEYTSPEAKQIDEGIFFYVADEYISLNDDELAVYVEKSIS